jgi:hypothetical protein
MKPDKLFHQQLDRINIWLGDMHMAADVAVPFWLHLDGLKHARAVQDMVYAIRMLLLWQESRGTEPSGSNHFADDKHHPQRRDCDSVQNKQRLAIPNCQTSNLPGRLFHLKTDTVKLLG